MMKSIMELQCVGVYIGAFVVSLSFFACFSIWFNEWRFVRRSRASAGGARLPPGSMGLPLLGEMLDFLWCFKYSRRPDDFIAKRKIRYGDTGIYRTHLFGSPAILTCSPEMNKEVLQSSTEDGKFSTGWPSNQLMEAFNNRKALALHLTSAQPYLISTLEEWVLCCKCNCI